MDLKSIHKLKLKNWIFTHYEIWEKICGLEKMSIKDSKKIFKLLEKEDFIELMTVVITRQSAMEIIEENKNK